MTKKRSKIDKNCNHIDPVTREFKCRLLVCIVCDKPVMSCQVPPSRLRVGIRVECSPCGSARTIANLAKRPGVARERHWREDGLDFMIQDHDRMHEEQEGKCLICKRHESELNKVLHLDHCHKTKVIRGLICDDCNILLGKARESAEVLLSAIAYLERFVA